MRVSRGIAIFVFVHNCACSVIYFGSEIMCKCLSRRARRHARERLSVWGFMSDDCIDYVRRRMDMVVIVTGGKSCAQQRGNLLDSNYSNSSQSLSCLSSRELCVLFTTTDLHDLNFIITRRTCHQSAIFIINTLLSAVKSARCDTSQHSWQLVTAALCGLLLGFQIASASCFV